MPLKIKYFTRAMAIACFPLAFFPLLAVSPNLQIEKAKEARHWEMSASTSIGAYYLDENFFPDNGKKSSGDIFNTDNKAIPVYSAQLDLSTPVFFKMIFRHDRSVSSQMPILAGEPYSANLDFSKRSSNDISALSDYSRTLASLEFSIENFFLFLTGEIKTSQRQARIVGNWDDTNKTYQPLTFATSTTYHNLLAEKSIALERGEAFTYFQQRQTLSAGGGFKFMRFTLGKDSLNSPAYVRLIEDNGTIVDLLTEGSLQGYFMEFSLNHSFPVMDNLSLEILFPLKIGSFNFQNSYFTSDQGLLISYGFSLKLNYSLLRKNSLEILLGIGLDWQKSEIHFSPSRDYFSVKEEIVFQKNPDQTIPMGAKVKMTGRITNEFFFPFFAVQIKF